MRRIFEVMLMMILVAALLAPPLWAQSERPAVGKGWMSFTVTAGNVLHLGGANQTTPTAQLSAGNLLATGIPQNDRRTGFRPGGGVKHAQIRLVSGTWRTADDGSTPTSTLGNSDTRSISYSSSPQALFNFKAYAVTTATIEVQLWE